jgi:hypothetical protein
MPGRTRFVRRVCAVAIGLMVGSASTLVIPGVAAADRDVDGRDAVLGPPAEQVVRSLAPDQGCQMLLDSGNGECQVVRTLHGDLVVTVEHGRRLGHVLVTRPWIVHVYRPSTALPDGWELALSTRAEDREPGPLFAEVVARGVDVTGDGHDELVLGYRSEGTGQILDVDVVGTDAEGRPSVLGHDQLYKGNVVFRRGHLVAYVPVYRRADANCCPTWIQRLVFRYDGGAFRVDAGRRVPTRRADIPPSQLA